MPNDAYIAGEIRRKPTTHRSKSEAIKAVCIKAFYVAVIAGGTYFSSQPATDTSLVRFMSACQSLKKRGGENVTREATNKSGCVEYDTPPNHLAKMDMA